jgi:hypothetical protein
MKELLVMKEFWNFFLGNADIDLRKKMRDKQFLWILIFFFCGWKEDEDGGRR